MLVIFSNIVIVIKCVDGFISQMFLECLFSLYALCECIMRSVHERRFILRRSRESIQNQQSKDVIEEEGVRLLVQV